MAIFGCDLLVIGGHKHLINSNSNNWNRIYTACNLLVIDLHLVVSIARNDLQHNVKHAEIFTCYPLIS